MEIYKIPDDLKVAYKQTIQKIREHREQYFEWLQNEIEDVINLINTFDKIHVIGGLGTRLTKQPPAKQVGLLKNAGIARQRLIPMAQITQNSCSGYPLCGLPLPGT